jgi:hypothetical protein
MKSKHHKAIQQFLWNRKNKPFLFAELKKKVYGYTEYGGRKYLRWIKANYDLKSFKKDSRIWLQKIQKRKKESENVN